MDRFFPIIAFVVLLGCDKPKTTKDVSSSDSVNDVKKKYGQHQLGYGEPPFLRKLDSLLNQLDTVTALALIKKEKVDINFRYDDILYGTLLYHFACENENKKYPKPKINPLIVKFLLRNGADPNTVGIHFGEYSGHDYPVVTCDPKISEVLIRAGSKYQIPLIIPCAAQQGDKATIVKAIESGANPSLALPYAYKYDREFFTELLSNSKTNKDWALRIASSGSTEIGIVDIPQGLKPIEVEADTSLIRKLVLLGADPNNALPYCIRNRFYELVQFLLNNGADKNNALFFAIMGGVPDISFVKKMIQRGARLNSPSLQYFSENEELQSLLLPVVDGFGYSVVSEQAGDMESIVTSDLLEACDRSENENAEFMLKTGADPNVYADPSQAFDHEINQACNKISALWLAMYKNNRELVGLLRKYKAKLPQGCKPPANWVEGE